MLSDGEPEVSSEALLLTSLHQGMDHSAKEEIAFEI